MIKYKIKPISADSPGENFKFGAYIAKFQWNRPYLIHKLKIFTRKNAKNMEYDKGT